jgi:hypothetical protein
MLEIQGCAAPALTDSFGRLIFFTRKAEEGVF